MTFGSRRLKFFVISATVTLALLILTSLANASLVLGERQNTDQSYKVAGTAPQTQQADLQKETPKQETATAPVDDQAQPDVKAEKKTRVHASDREDRVERVHRRLHRFSRRLHGWLHRWRIGRRW